METITNTTAGSNSIKPAIIEKAQNAMVASYNSTHETIGQIENRLADITQKSESFWGRLFMSDSEEALLQAQEEHHIAVYKEVNDAHLQQAKDILEARTRATREACNSVLLTVITQLKVLSAETANKAIKGATERMLNDMHSTLAAIDASFKKSEEYHTPQVKNTALQMAAASLQTVENCFSEFLGYIANNNLIK